MHTSNKDIFVSRGVLHRNACDEGRRAAVLGPFRVNSALHLGESAQQPTTTTATQGFPLGNLPAL